MNSRKDKINLLSNYCSRLWGALSVFIFVPLYLGAFGEDNYSIISIGVSITLLIAVLDAGLTPAITRSAAKGADYRFFYFVLRKFLIRLCFFLLAILAITYAAYIAFEFSGSIDQLTITAIYASAFSHLFVSIFRGIFYGVEQHAIYNFSSVLYSLLRSAMPLLTIYISSSMFIFFIVQMTISFLFGLYLWNVLKSRVSVDGEWDGYHLIFKKQFSNERPFMGTMLLVTIVSTCISQMDRLFIGWFYGLEVVGRYVNIVMLAQSGSLLLLPIMASVYPKMIGLGLKNNFWSISLHKYLYAVLGINALFTFIMIALFPKIYEVWTQIKFPEEMHTVYLCAVCSNALNGFQLCAYHMMLARGDVVNYARILIIYLAISPVFYFGISSFFSISFWGYPILLINLILTSYFMMRLYWDIKHLFNIHAKFLFGTALFGAILII